jgi:hypothetical protein
MSLCCQIRQILESLQGAAGSGAADKDSHQLRPEPTVVGMSRRVNGIMKDSDHFAYPRGKRMEIVQHYRLDCINGEVRNKDHWARRNYQISSRTLFNYEREFPQVEESVSVLSIAGPAGSG